MIKKIALLGVVSILLTQFTFAKSPTYYGVVIGCCGNYENGGIDALNAQADANMFYNKLVNLYYNGDRNRANKNIDLLTEKRATKANIKNSLKKIAEKAQPEDIVYFFYSGHGSSLEDKSKIIAPSYKNNELINVMTNSGLIVPYDFNLKKVFQTSIIGKRDLKDNGGYGFQYLDDNNVKVIMISDSCYSGNIYRTSKKSRTKFIPLSERNLEDEIKKQKIKLSRVKERSNYKHLIFFSAGGTDKAVAEDKRLHRGKFSLVIEKCLKTANQNSDRKITKKEFAECLHTEDTAKAFVYYPVNRLSNATVFKSSSKNISVTQKDKIRVKTSIQGLTNFSNQIVIDNKNYDIEIIQIGNSYQIFRYTGEEYALVEKQNIETYLNSLKLFKLKGRGKLKANVVNNSEKNVGRYCRGENVFVELQSQKNNILAITLDKEGKVIMIYPNDQRKPLSSSLEFKVQYPYGLDKIKIFSLATNSQYNKVKKLIAPNGDLDANYGVNKLYSILKKNKNYKEIEIDIETLDKDKNYCKQGD